MNVSPFLRGIVLLLSLGETLSSVTNANCEDITQRQQEGNTTYLSSSSRYAPGGNLRAPIPRHAKEGDLLVLFLSRSDGGLPVELDGWTTGPSCFKENNRGNNVEQCWTAEDCLETTNGDTAEGTKYCSRFPLNHTGEDLATIVLYKPIIHNDYDDEAAANDNDPMFHINLPGISPAWATLAAISNVNMTNPIRSSAGVSCDKKAAGVFPTVHGEAGDLLLLSMAHDDPANQTAFQAPLGTRLVQVQHGFDEAGFLFARRLNVTGTTSTYATKGEGTQWWCKDALLSVVIRMLPLDDDDNNDNNELLLVNENDDPCRDDIPVDSDAITLSDLFSWLWKWKRDRGGIFG